MDISEVLKLADELVFEKTGKHLDYLQEAIMRRSWQDETYSEIAEKLHASQSHVRNTGSELWKIISEQLGENITKSNFKSLFEQSNFYNISSPIGRNFLEINHKVNVCTETRQPSTSQQNPQQTSKPHYDLIEAPEIFSFYNRHSELSTLKQWILQARSRLITIYGLSGIGKSAITLKLIEQIQTEFDYIIWRSLSNTPTLLTLQTDLNQFLSRSQPTPLPTVIDYFRASRCLVILDDVQNIFTSGQLAGQYLAGYENYGKFFKQVATTSHQSCLILLSWEKPREVATLEGEPRFTRTLHLKGLDVQSHNETSRNSMIEIFREKGLTDEEKWSELINRYQGHPEWLNIIASTIMELFNGSVSQFLAEQNDIFLGDIESLLDTQLERLSKSETKVSQWLASQSEGVDISQFHTEGELCKSELWQAIQSLARRGLVEKVQVGAQAMFHINSVFKQYIQ